MRIGAPRAGPRGARRRLTRSLTAAPAPSPLPSFAVREAGAYTPIVNTLLDGVLDFDDAQFRAELKWLYPLLSGRITCGSVAVRSRVRDVFETRLRPLMNF